MELTYHDLQFVLQRSPWGLLHTMRKPEWHNRIFVGGGFIRSVVAGDPINDVDVFVSSKEDARKLADVLTKRDKDPLVNPSEYGIFESDNAFTLTKIKPTIQIIHRWVFDKGIDVADSFDFTICCAVFWWGHKTIIDGNAQPDSRPAWCSFCDDRFYPDVAARRLIYRKPKRNEDAGGSLLRVLKYYQKGYRIPVDSLAAVIGRLMAAYQPTLEFTLSEEHVSKVVCGLLREVDPEVDPNHISHLPASSTAPNDTAKVVEYSSSVKYSSAITLYFAGSITSRSDLVVSLNPSGGSARR